MAEILGAMEYVTGWRLTGPPPESTALLKIGLSIVRFVGMTPDGEPDLRVFPNAAGLGGEGAQIYIPLTESYLIAGTWPQLGITRFLLSSCKPYDRAAVAGFFKQLTGLPVIKAGQFEF